MQKKCRFFVSPMDLIDAAWSGGGSAVAGDSGSGGYTTYAWEIGVGKGLTVTPAGGDTAKKLFIPNIGRRLEGSGTAHYHGEYAYLWSTNQYNVADAYRLFVSSYYSEVISVLSKGRAYSLRCVRS